LSFKSSSMFEFLDTLRKKPESQKKRIAFGTAFFCSGFIFLLWVLVWYPSFRDRQDHIEQAAPSSPSPWSTFSNVVGSGFEEASGQAQKIKETANSFTFCFRHCPAPPLLLLSWSHSRCLSKTQNMLNKIEPTAFQCHRIICLSSSF
jgi:hypothetical protein